MRGGGGVLDAGERIVLDAGKTSSMREGGIVLDAGILLDFGWIFSDAGGIVLDPRGSPPIKTILKDKVRPPQHRRKLRQLPQHALNLSHECLRQDLRRHSIQKRLHRHRTPMYHPTHADPHRSLIEFGGFISSRNFSTTRFVCPHSFVEHSTSNPAGAPNCCRKSIAICFPLFNTSAFSCRFSFGRVPIALPKASIRRHHAHTT